MKQYNKYIYILNKFFINKKLGQHFLIKNKIAKKIVDSLSFKNYNTVLEVGPGLGILTKYLLKKPNLFIIEIDKRLVDFLKKKYYNIKKKIIHKDFLKWDPEDFSLKNFAIIGNFPYNISSKILFHILKYEQYIPECIGMFSKEVVKKITSKEGNKKYGISSILVQSFYNIKYLFTVKKNVFYPVPKVESSVISLTRNNNVFSSYKKKLLFNFVKTAFNKRRKKLKNSLKLYKNTNILNFNKNNFLDKRAEELSVKEFNQLVK